MEQTDLESSSQKCPHDNATRFLSFEFNFKALRYASARVPLIPHRKLSVLCTHTLQNAPAKHDSGLAQTSMPTATNFSLPSVLPKPNIREVNRAAIDQCFPEMAYRTTQSIREELFAVGARMLHTLGIVRIKLPTTRGTPPQSIEIPVDDSIATFCPTHVLAVYSPLPDQPKDVFLMATHAIILQVYCSHLLEFPISRPDIRRDVSLNGTITLPAVPMRIPNVMAFRYLHTYLYNKDGDALIAWLLPMPIRSHTPLFELISLLSRCDFDTLIKSGGRIRSLYTTACALRVADHVLWRVIEFTWAGFIRAVGEVAADSNSNLELVEANSTVPYYD